MFKNTHSILDSLSVSTLYIPYPCTLILIHVDQFWGVPQAAIGYLLLYFMWEKSLDSQYLFPYLSLSLPLRWPWRSRQWLSRITPESSPPTVVMSPPSVMLMSVPFSLRTVAFPVYMLITRPSTSPSQGCGYRRLPPHPHGSVGYDTLVARRSRV